MDYINFIELSDEEKYCIVESLARTGSVNEAREEFNKGHKTKIEGSTVVKVASHYRAEIGKLKKALYNEEFSDIDIASLRNRLNKLDEIYEVAIQQIEVGA